MSADSLANRDIKKLLGNPKITFVLGNQRPLLTQCRWTCFRQGYPMRQIGGRVWLYSHFNWRSDES